MNRQILSYSGVIQLTSCPAHRGNTSLAFIYTFISIFLIYKHTCSSDSLSTDGNTCLMPLSINKILVRGSFFMTCEHHDFTALKKKSFNWQQRETKAQGNSLSLFKLWTSPEKLVKVGHGCHSQFCFHLCCSTPAPRRHFPRFSVLSSPGSEPLNQRLPPESNWPFPSPCVLLCRNESDVGNQQFSKLSRFPISGKTQFGTGDVGPPF